MTDTQVETQVSNDPWEVADNAKPREYEYYGQVKADVWFGFFPGGGEKPIPYDPQQHPADKRVVMIDIQIIPISAQAVTFDIRQNYTDFSPDWTKITLPSIKATGLDGIRALNNRFVRVVQVPGKREKKDANGKKTGEFYSTFKFLEVFADQATCDAAYQGVAPHSTEQPPLPDTSDVEKKNAITFARVVVEKNVKGRADLQEIIDAVTKEIAVFPLISKHYSGSSPEILTLINEAMSK